MQWAATAKIFAVKAKKKIKITEEKSSASNTNKKKAA